jgi:ribosomal protein L29
MTNSLDELADKLRGSTPKSLSQLLERSAAQLGLPAIRKTRAIVKINEALQANNLESYLTWAAKKESKVTIEELIITIFAFNLLGDALQGRKPVSSDDQKEVKAPTMDENDALAKELMFRSHNYHIPTIDDNAPNPAITRAGLVLQLLRDYGSFSFAGEYAPPSRYIYSLSYCQLRNIIIEVFHSLLSDIGNNPPKLFTTEQHYCAQIRTAFTQSGTRSLQYNLEEELKAEERRVGKPNPKQSDEHLENARAAELKLREEAAALGVSVPDEEMTSNQRKILKNKLFKLRMQKDNGGPSQSKNEISDLKKQIAALQRGQIYNNNPGYNNGNSYSTYGNGYKGGGYQQQPPFQQQPPQGGKGPKGMRPRKPKICPGYLDGSCMSPDGECRRTPGFRHWVENKGELDFVCTSVSGMPQISDVEKDALVVQSQRAKDLWFAANTTRTGPY